MQRARGRCFWGLLGARRGGRPLAQPVQGAVPPSVFVTTYSSSREALDMDLLLCGGQRVHPELASPPPDPEQWVLYPWWATGTWPVLRTC